MKIICVNFLVILLVNIAFNFVKANNSTLWPLFDNLEEDSTTVLPKPIESTKPTTIQSINQTDLLNSNNLKISNSSSLNKSTTNDQQKVIDKIETVNQSSDLLNERSRTSKHLSGTLPFGTKLKIKPVDLNRNQSVANVDLQSNMTVISGRSFFDDSQSKQSNDYGDHMSAYDKITLQNEKFAYDHFFELYDMPASDDLQTKSHKTSKTPYENENQVNNQYPYQHLVQYRPSNILPPLPVPQQHAVYQNPHLPYEYPLPYHAFSPPSYSTVQKFRQYQKQRIKELLHRPVSEMFAGKFKPDYVPKYMLEAPQRSHQQTGLGELFIVLGPLVILPLLSSFALSTFTTLYVTKSLIAKPAAATTTARHKQFNGKLLKDEHFQNHSSLFNLIAPDESLVYHPFNASEFDVQVLTAKNKNEQRMKKSKNLEDLKSHQKDQKEFKSLEDESLKGLKRSKRTLRQDLILKELGLDENEFIENDDKPKKRIRREWNEVLWTKPKPDHHQTPWLPLTKKLARQPRNSFHTSKLFVVRPVKKVYRNVSKNSLKLKDLNVNLTKIHQMNADFNQPSNLLNFAINDAIENAKHRSKFDQTKFDKNFENFLYQSAASSPSPSYINFTSTMEPNFNKFNYQPKIYNLKTNSPLTEQQLIKRHSATSPSNYSLNYRTNAINGVTNLASAIYPVLSNDTAFQDVTLLNPFHTPTFLSDKKQRSNELNGNLDNSRLNTANQGRSKNARKMNLDDSKKDLDKDVFDTSMPLDDWNEEHDFTNKNVLRQKESQESSALNSDLDVVQKYLKQTRPDGEYNDEIIATYLSCNGLLNSNNKCLHLLVCQYVDTSVKMPELEKEVASLIIYSILKNKFVDDEIKQSMRLAAQLAIRKHGQCSQYQCLRTKPTRT